MGLDCGCPKAASIASLPYDSTACKSSFGQIQKIFFQRIMSATAGVKNKIDEDDIIDLATWTALTTATDNTKLTVSPFIQNPETEPGAPRTFGGDNQTRGGVPIIIGREPTTFTGVFYEENQAIMKAMKTYGCEDIAVWLVDEYGNIGCLSETVTSGSTTTTNYLPIPVQSFFVGDMDLGGYAEPDSNQLQFSFLPNWSDDFAIVKRGDLEFDPLTEVVNPS